MKTTTITREREQSRTTIPKKYVKILKIKKGEKILWKINKKTRELFGFLNKKSTKAETEGDKKSSKESVINPEKQICG